MPHLTVEYCTELADDFAPRALLKALNRTLIASGLFSVTDIKSRAIALDTVLVGDGAPDRFVHIEVALLSGRPLEVRRQLASALLASAEAELDETAQRPLQVSVEVRELDKDSYAKRVL
jgi:5-carboxymethyl-2-hydroxymuconate isomerase